ncbi:hypothetical protein EYF80_066474 [Liparis tanakae]|uniref:Uncharacterized protein n=1 Tax=Liparis tanakae TaxID=230148 RepID=A0A4Z2E3Q4_9TELE|nr:hypothetical protein EYF80_066474 [Liparis tanakae]
MPSCWRIMVFTRSLTCGCWATASSESSPLSRLGPKHTARL